MCWIQRLDRDLNRVTKIRLSNPTEVNHCEFSEIWFWYESSHLFLGLSRECVAFANAEMSKHERSQINDNKNRHLHFNCCYIRSHSVLFAVTENNYSKSFDNFIRSSFWRIVADFPRDEKWVGKPGKQIAGCQPIDIFSTFDWKNWMGYGSQSKPINLDWCTTDFRLRTFEN